MGHGAESRHVVQSVCDVPLLKPTTYNSKGRRCCFSYLSAEQCSYLTARISLRCSGQIFKGEFQSIAVEVSSWSSHLYPIRFTVNLKRYVDKCETPFMWLFSSPLQSPECHYSGERYSAVRGQGITLSPSSPSSGDNLVNKSR